MDKYFDSMSSVELADALLNSNLKECSRCTQDGLKCMERGCIVDKVAERLKELSKDVCCTVEENNQLKQSMLMHEYKDVAELKKQIHDFKRAVNSSNGEYMTGYISALSVVEGMIAGLPDVNIVSLEEHEATKKNLDAAVTALASIKEIAESLEHYINDEVHPAVDYCIYSSLIDDVQRIQNLIEKSEET